MGCHKELVVLAVELGPCFNFGVDEIVKEPLP